MSIVVDEIIGKVLSHTHPLDEVTSDPSAAEDGTMILNTTDSKIKIWYASQWQVLHTLTAPPSGTSGSPIGLLLSLTYA